MDGYGKIAQAEYTSDQGRTWKLFVLVEGIADANPIPALDGYGDWTIDHGGSGASVFEPVISTRANIAIADNERYLYDIIAGRNDRDVAIELLHEEDTHFIGYLVPDSVQRELVDDDLTEISVVSFSATDALKQLDKDGFVDDFGVPLSDRATFVQIVDDVLSPIGLDLPVASLINWKPFLDGAQLADTDSILEHLKADRGVFRDQDGNPLSRRFVLEQTTGRLLTSLVQTNLGWTTVQRSQVTRRVEGEIPGRIWDGESGSLFGFKGWYGVRGIEVGGFERKLPALRSASSQYDHRTAFFEMFQHLDLGAPIKPHTAPNDEGNWKASHADVTWHQGSPPYVRLPAVYNAGDDPIPGSVSTLATRWLSQTGGSLQGGAGRSAILKYDVKSEITNFELPEAGFFAVYWPVNVRVGSYWLNQNPTTLELYWSTSATERPVVFFQDPATVWQTIEFVLPELLDGSTPISGQVQILAYNPIEGYRGEGASAAISHGRISRFQFVLIGDGEEDPEATRTVVSVIDSPDTETDDDFVFMIGDGPTTGHVRRLKVVDGADVERQITDGWKDGVYSNGTTTGYSIDRLHAEERVRQFSIPQRRLQFSFMEDVELYEPYRALGINSETRVITQPFPENTDEIIVHNWIQPGRTIAIQPGTADQQIVIIESTTGTGPYTLKLTAPLTQDVLAESRVIWTDLFTWTWCRRSLIRGKVEVEAVEYYEGDFAGALALIEEEIRGEIGVQESRRIGVVQVYGVTGAETVPNRAALAALPKPPTLKSTIMAGDQVAFDGGGGLMAWNPDMDAAGGQQPLALKVGDTPGGWQGFADAGGYRVKREGALGNDFQEEKPYFDRLLQADEQKPILLDPGIYQTSKLAHKPGAHHIFKGQGEATILKLRDGAMDMIVNAGADTIFEFHDLVIDGNFEEQGDDWNYALELTGRRCLFHNVTFRKTRQAAVNLGGIDAHFEYCRWSDFAEHSGVPGEETLAIRMVGFDGTLTVKNSILRGHVPSVAGAGPGGIFVAGFGNSVTVENVRAYLMGQNRAGNLIGGLLDAYNNVKVFISDCEAHDWLVTPFKLQRARYISAKGLRAYNYAGSPDMGAPGFGNQALDYAPAARPGTFGDTDPEEGGHLSDVIIDGHPYGFGMVVQGNNLDTPEPEHWYIDNVKLSNIQIHNCWRGMQIRTVRGKFVCDGLLLENCGTAQNGFMALQILECSGDAHLNDTIIDGGLNGIWARDDLENLRLYLNGYHATNVVVQAATIRDMKLLRADNVTAIPGRATIAGTVNFDVVRVDDVRINGIDVTGNFRGEYDANTTYAKGDQVRFSGGADWVSKVDDNEGNSPDTSPDEWAQGPVIGAHINSCDRIMIDEAVSRGVRIPLQFTQIGEYAGISRHQLRLDAAETGSTAGAIEVRASPGAKILVSHGSTRGFFNGMFARVDNEGAEFYFTRAHFEDATQYGASIHDAALLHMIGSVFDGAGSDLHLRNIDVVAVGNIARNGTLNTDATVELRGMMNSWQDDLDLSDYIQQGDFAELNGAVFTQAIEFDKALTASTMLQDWMQEFGLFSDLVDGVSRLWFNAPDQGHMVFGPRVGGHTLARLNFMANQVGMGFGFFEPTERLDVNGRIRSRVQTEASAPDDIVTTKGYVDDLIDAITLASAEPSPNTAEAVSATYQQPEVQAILDELRDLKDKMRAAGLLQQLPISMTAPENNSIHPAGSPITLSVEIVDVDPDSVQYKIERIDG